MLVNHPEAHNIPNMVKVLNKIYSYFITINDKSDWNDK
jgi:hypothetical protein